MHPHLPPAIPLALIVTLSYLLWVWLNPWKTCRRCHGYGRTPTGRGRPKLCRRCDGHGIRPRAIRRSQRAAKRMLRDARREPRR